MKGKGEAKASKEGKKKKQREKIERTTVWQWAKTTKK